MGARRNDAMPANGISEPDSGLSATRGHSRLAFGRHQSRLPEALRGTFYRNGPAVHERFGLRYQHLFDGDGMVQAFRFDGRGVTHRARVLATPKLTRETEAGRRRFSGFATEVDGALALRRADDINPANISVLHHHGELLALWEGGSAIVLDPDSLEWRGFKVWGAGLEGLPFTAHPRVEADGTVWAFGYAFARSPALVLYHIAPDGALVKAKVLDPGPLGMVHDFVVTARHLVIVIPPLVFEPSRAEGSLLDAFVWRPELGSRVLVVDKDDFDHRRWYQLPAAFGFHHGNGWTDQTGTIRYDHCVAADATLMTDTMRDIMRGQLTPGAPEHYARFTLHADGRVEMDDFGEQAEFPRIAPALTGRRNRYVYTLGAPSQDPKVLEILQDGGDAETGPGVVVGGRLGHSRTGICTDLSATIRSGGVRSISRRWPWSRWGRATAQPRNRACLNTGDRLSSTRTSRSRTPSSRESCS